MWEIRAFTGRGADGSPTQVSRTVRGTKNDALRVAAELTVTPAGRAAGRSVSDVLDAWVQKHDATWAPASRRDQLSRVARINGDRIARLSVARLKIEDVERWHARLRDEGLADVSIRNVHGVLRAALTEAVRWGWVSRNVAPLAELSSRKVAPRGVLSAADVRHVIAVGDAIGSEVGLMLRLAAATGALVRSWRRCSGRTWWTEFSLVATQDARDIAPTILTCWFFSKTLPSPCRTLWRPNTIGAVCSSPTWVTISPTLAAGSGTVGETVQFLPRRHP